MTAAKRASNFAAGLDLGAIQKRTRALSATGSWDEDKGRMVRFKDAVLP